jgi:hypothetical protein
MGFLKSQRLLFISKFYNRTKEHAIRSPPNPLHSMPGSFCFSAIQKSEMCDGRIGIRHPNIHGVVLSIENESISSCGHLTFNIEQYTFVGVIHLLKL